MIVRNRIAQLMQQLDAQAVKIDESGTIPESALPLTVPLTDETGVIKTLYLPDLVITNTFFISAESQLMEQTLAKTGDIAIDNTNGVTYILAGTDYSVRDNWKEFKVKNDSPPPIGFTYMQAYGTPAPDVLWSGTTWEKAIPDGHFPRQEGGNAAAFGGWQNHALQDHKHPIRLGNLGGGNVISTATSADDTYGAYSNNPIQGVINANIAVETRPVNSTVRFWKRTA